MRRFLEIHTAVVMSGVASSQDVLGSESMSRQRTGERDISTTSQLTPVYQQLAALLDEAIRTFCRTIGTSEFDRLLDLLPSTQT